MPQVQFPITTTITGMINIPDPVIPTPDPSIQFAPNPISDNYTFKQEDNGLMFIYIGTKDSIFTIPKSLSKGWNAAVYRKDKTGNVKFASGGQLEGESDTLKRVKTAATIIHFGNDLHVILGAVGS